MQRIINGPGTRNIFLFLVVPKYFIQDQEGTNIDPKYFYDYKKYVLVPRCS